MRVELTQHIAAHNVVALVAWRRGCSSSSGSSIASKERLYVKGWTLAIIIDCVGTKVVCHPVRVYLRTLYNLPGAQSPNVAFTTDGGVCREIPCESPREEELAPWTECERWRDGTYIATASEESAGSNV